MSATAITAARRYIEIGRPERALESLAGLDSEAAASAEAHRLRGYAFYGLEDYERAVDEARAALADAPGSVELQFLLSLAEEQRGRLGEAEAAILAALEADADQPQLLCQYADVLMRGGELRKAERVLGAAAAADPDSPDVLEARISLAYLRGDDRAARRLSEELLAIAPESVRAQHTLGVFALNRGHARTAADRFGAVVRADPRDQARADEAREAQRLARNPLWWPTLVFMRAGVVGSWVGAMAIIFGLRAAGLEAASAYALLAWIVICVWSWVVPPVLGRIGR